MQSQYIMIESLGIFIHLLYKVGAVGVGLFVGYELYATIKIEKMTLSAQFSRHMHDHVIGYVMIAITSIFALLLHLATEHKELFSFSEINMILVEEALHALTLFSAFFTLGFLMLHLYTERRGKFE